MASKSKAQQRFMGMVYGVQKGTIDPTTVSSKVRDVARNMKNKDVKDFAETKHKNLPETVSPPEGNSQGQTKAAHVMYKLASKKGPIPKEKLQGRTVTDKDGNKTFELIHSQARQDALKNIHHSKFTEPITTSYIPGKDLEWESDVETNPDFSISPREVFKYHYGKDGKMLDEKKFKEDILDPAREMQEKYPTHQDYIKGPMQEHYNKENQNLSKYLKLNRLLSKENEPKQILSDKELDKLVGVKVIPPKKRGSVYLTEHENNNVAGIASRQGTAMTVGIETLDPTFKKKRVTFPHEMFHTTQSYAHPKGSTKKHNWTHRPVELQAGAAHIKREYYRSTGKVAKDPQSSIDALNWYENQVKKHGGTGKIQESTPEFQMHPGADQWLKESGTRKVLEGMMPFIVDRTNKAHKKSDKADKVLNKLAKKQTRSRKIKDSLAVGIAGSTSMVVPMVPFHTISAASRAPKDKKIEATSAAAVGGLVGNAPSLGYAYSKGRTATKSAVKKYRKKPSLKNLKGIGKALKKGIGKKHIFKYLAMSGLGQGTGAGIGYAMAVSDKKKKRK